MYRIRFDEIGRPLPGVAGGAISIGNFDGVHRGHAHLLDRLVSASRGCGGSAIAVTFDPPPRTILAPTSVPPPLLSLPRKLELLGAAGATNVVVLAPCHRMLALEPREFFDRVVVATLGARAVVEGAGFRFGKGRRGDWANMQEWCAAAGIRAFGVEEVADELGVVSSTGVRQALLGGDIAVATSLLGRAHRIEGIVERGEGRGAGLGFPTANLGSVETLLPADGVYAAGTAGTGSRRAVALHIGPNPTFGSAGRKVEAHVIGFEGDLVGQRLALDVVARVRGVEHFAGADALRRQLMLDVARVAEMVDVPGG